MRLVLINEEGLAVRKSSGTWFVYLLECMNGMIYTGITTNLEKRFQRHASGRGAKFTKRNPPSHIIAAKPFRTRSDASKAEWMVKRLTPAQKRAAASQWPITENLPKL